MGSLCLVGRGVIFHLFLGYLCQISILRRVCLVCGDTMLPTVCSAMEGDETIPLGCVTIATGDSLKKAFSLDTLLT